MKGLMAAAAAAALLAGAARAEVEELNVAYFWNGRCRSSSPRFRACTKKLWACP